MDLDKSVTRKKSISTEKNILSKLRRLKIQENIIIQNLKKSDRTVYFEDNVPIDPETKDLELANMEKKIKDKFIHLRNLFDEVQVHANSKELLADLDMEDMKRKIFELENNMKSFKSYLNQELNTLKVGEKQLVQEVNGNRENNEEKIKRQTKISSGKYNDIVPSPVKVLMTSPFKCMEVQQFQDFMKSSPNRYGGWNEYNHNIFVRFWQKCFGPNYSPDLEDGKIQLLNIYNVFVEEMSELHGVNTNDVISHIKWYVKYIYLKEEQQRALDKWKQSRRTIFQKDKTAAVSNNSFVSENERRKRSLKLQTTHKTNCKDNNEKRSADNYRKPTKQSQYRTYLENDVSYAHSHFSAQETKRLGVPEWRIGLQGS